MTIKTYVTPLLKPVSRTRIIATTPYIVQNYTHRYRRKCGFRHRRLMRAFRVFFACTTVALLVMSAPGAAGLAPGTSAPGAARNPAPASVAQAQARRENLRHLASKREILLMHSRLTDLLKVICPSGSGSGR